MATIGPQEGAPSDSDPSPVVEPEQEASQQAAEGDASTAAEEPAQGTAGSQELFIGGSVLALLGAVLLPLADALLARAVGGARIPGAVFFARWGFRHVVIAIAIGVTVGTLAAVLVGLLELGFLSALVASQLLMVSIAVVALLQARRLHPEGIDALGLRARGTFDAILGAGMTYVLAVPCLLGVALLWPGLAGAFGVEIESQRVVQELLELEGPALVLAIGVAVIVAPVFEELVFRAYLQPLLVQNLHAPAGILVTSILFGALHGPAFLPIVALSTVLGWIHWRTHNTWACIAVHALHNGGMILLLLLSSVAAKAAL